MKGKVVLVSALMSSLIINPVYASDILGGLGEANPQVSMGATMGSLLGQSDTGRLIALDDLNISVKATNYVSCSQDDGFVYIYTMDDNSMPYVIIGKYDMGSDGFVDKFTEYMSGEYSDLDVNSVEEGIQIGDKTFDKVTYNYTVSGYTVDDTRLFTGDDQKTYMFGSKEVPELDKTVGDGFLDSIASSYAMLAGGDGDYEFHVDATRSLTEPYNGAEVQTSVETQPTTEVQTIGLSGAGNADNITVSTENTNETINETTNETTNDSPLIEFPPETNQDTQATVFDTTSAGYEGVWCPFADGFQLYLPATWNTFQVPDEAKQSGCIYQAGDIAAQTDPTASYIYVNAADVSPYGYTTMDDIKNDLVASGYNILGVTNINGIECISYTYANPNLSALMFYGPNDSNYVFAVIAYNYDKHSEMQSVLNSLSLYQG